MLYEYKGKIYIRVSNRYYEVNIDKKDNGTFTVIPNKKKDYIEVSDKSLLVSITVEAAYKKSKRIEEPLNPKL